MADSVQPTEGQATLQYQVILSGKRTLVFDEGRVAIEEAELHDSVYGEGRGIHIFSTQDPAFIEALREAMSDADPVLEFRLGYGAQAKYWLPWQQHTIVKYSANFEGIGNSAGHRIVLVTANALTRVARISKVRAHSGLISDIVKAIATENKLEMVVEPTDGQFLLYQSFCDDVDFVDNRLLPRAINAKGRGGFYFYIRDNILHFHSPDYQTSAKELNYYNTFGTGLNVSDLSQDPSLWDNGIAGIDVTEYNPETGRTRLVKNDPNRSLRLADSLYQFSNIKGGQLNVHRHRSFNPPVESSALAQFKYQRTRQQVFRTSVNTSKLIGIRHGDLLNLIVEQQAAKASSHGGMYYVAATTHMIKKQAVTSAYTLERGEIKGQDQSVSTQNAQQQLVPLSKAPGDTPNIAEIQGSDITRGAGKQSSARTFTVVADANKG